MIQFLRSQLPSAVFVFIISFIIIKIPFFIDANEYSIPEVQNYWTAFSCFCSKIKFISICLGLIAILLQSIWFNYLFHQADYYENTTMIPAYFYVLVSSLIPEFNILSIYTVINFLLLLLIHIALHINQQENAKITSFNFGLVTAVLVVLNVHFFMFVPFVFIILYVLKPFRTQEYILLLSGILFVFYTLLSISYLTNATIDVTYLTLKNFRIFYFKKDILSNLLLILTAVYLLFSFISLRGIMYSTGFKRRKNVNMLVFLFIGLTVTVLFSRKLEEPVLAILIIPISTFFALFMLRIRKKRIGEILNAIFVIVIFVTNIIRIIK